MITRAGTPQGRRGGAAEAEAHSPMRTPFGPGREQAGRSGGGRVPGGTWGVAQKEAPTQVPGTPAFSVFFPS